ncbi:MAG: signal peptidase I [bacterium JZ-2024 1]
MRKQENPRIIPADGKTHALPLKNRGISKVSLSLGWLRSTPSAPASKTLLLSSSDSEETVIYVSSRQAGKGWLRIEGEKSETLPVVFRATPLSILLDWAESVAFAVFLFLILRAFVVEAFYIPSESMAPTLQKGDRLLAWKFLFWFRSPYRGEIIIFKYPQQPEKNFVKRVIGIPGDVLEIRRDGFYINNQKVSEPYAPSDWWKLSNWEWWEFSSPEQRWKVPPHSFFVMGDNRNNSLDSRKWGVVPFSCLIGKPFLIFWPPHRVGRVKNYPLLLKLSP